MSRAYQTLISADELASLLANETSVRVFDCRARLGQPTRGSALFAEGHIQGALHADLDTHLAGKPVLREDIPCQPSTLGCNKCVTGDCDMTSKSFSTMTPAAKWPLGAGGCFAGLVMRQLRFWMAVWGNTAAAVANRRRQNTRAKQLRTQKNR